MQHVYKIRDAQGVVVAEHVRFSKPGGKKGMYWQLPNGSIELGEGGSEALPLYGTERLADLPVGATVLLCEGEKATEAAWQLGWPAVGTVTGASGLPCEDSLAVLLPFNVVTWEDFDAPGATHMEHAVARLRRIGGDARRLRWGREKGDDAADFLAAGVSRGVLGSLVRLAPRWHDGVKERPEPKPARVTYRSDHGRIDRARAQLFEVVTSRLGAPVLTNRQGAWWRCPFHAESTPSFKVDTREPFFRCLSGQTKVMTWDGIVPIRELAGGAHKLLTTGGVWVDAPIQSYGQDKVSRIHLTRNGVKRVVNATADHRWIIRTDRAGVYRESTTATLKSGSRLAYAYPPLGMLMKAGPAPFGIAQGFVFGDGTQTESGGAHVFFHGEKREMLRYFPEARQWGSEELPAVGRLPRFFRALPPLNEAPGYLYGWLAGYFAADGCVSKDGQVILSSAVKENLEYVATLASHLGIGVYGLKRQYRLGKGREVTPLYHLTFINSTLTGDFFVREKHRERFEAVMTDGRIERRGWVVDGIETTALREEVFCATVDRTHAFALDGNLLTGNCFGCSARGDVFIFLRQLDGDDFKATLRDLAPAPALGGIRGFGT